MIQNIVIVNSIFPLKHPQKRGRGNHLIYRCLSKTKSIGSGSDLESQADRQSDGYGVWSLDGEGGRGKGQIRIGYVEAQCFKFGVKELAVTAALHQMQLGAVHKVRHARGGGGPRRCT